MSGANVEVVRTWFEEWNVTQELDLSIYHPDLVYHPRSDEPDPTVRVGLDEYRQLLLGFQESLAGITFEMLDLIDAGDFVIASTVLHARGSASGVEVNDAYVFVNRFREGMVVEGWEFRTTEEALDALALRQHEKLGE